MKEMERVKMIMVMKAKVKKMRVMKAMMVKLETSRLTDITPTYTSSRSFVAFTNIYFLFSIFESFSHTIN
jgi:hypothetical protein